ncbi:hypothetical protein [Thioalkalivibrio sp. ALJ15]|uniref:hypothetical protein n=1 Tax=Thioalkalivibrio sp. ALJ15 TaxID=748652 RepID=UPI000381D3E2|nr:hypothetical protein [Thioalkalivibrio sp. ALJ15]
MNSIPRYRQCDALSILPMVAKADLNNWIGRGALTLDNPDATPRRYSDRDLVAIACMWELRRQHIPPGAAARIAIHAKDRTRNWSEGGRSCAFLFWFQGDRVTVRTVAADQVGQHLTRNVLGAPASVTLFHVDDVIEAVHQKIQEAAACQAAA